MGMSDSKRIVSNTLMLYMMTAGKYLLPFITLPYLTRVLTPEYYGVVIYMTSTMTYFQVLVDFGFIYSSTKEVSLHRTDRQYLGNVLSNTIFAKLILCAMGAAFLIIIMPFIAILRENAWLTIFYYFSVVVTAFLPDYIYRGMENMKVVSVRFILARLVSTLLTFMLIKSPNDLLWMPILTICGNLVAVIFSFTHLYKKEHIYLCKSSLTKAVKTLKQSSVFFASLFATTAFGATTTFFMGIQDISIVEIAYWGLAYQIICAIQMLYDPIMSSIYPHMVKKKDYGLIRKIQLLFMPIILLGVVISYFGAEWGIRVVGGSEYGNATFIFQLLLPMLIFSFPAQLLGFPVLAAMDKEKWATFSTIISAVFHVLGLVLLINFDVFTLINIAILRSCTDLILLISRIGVFRVVANRNIIMNEYGQL